MKVLVCEHLTAEGHANLFVNVCKLLVNSGYEVIAAVPKNFTKEISFCEIIKMDLKYYSDEYPHSSSVNKALYGLRVQNFMHKLYKVNDIKVTFVITYDEIALALGRFFFFIKGTFFIIQNLNPDAINKSKIRRIAYDLVKNKVYSIVLAGFIKDFLVSSLRTNPNKILILPHPMTPVDSLTIPDIDCVGISNSNDESFIDKIINREQKEGLIQKNNIKVVLKSKRHKYDNGNLIIISGFIDSSLYDNYIAHAKCILMPFPTSFKFRMSGTLVDALSNNKSVIGSDIPIISHSAKCYNNVIKIFNESTFVNDVIESGKSFNSKLEEYRRFQEIHSEDTLSLILSNAIDNALADKPMRDYYDF